MIKLSRLGEFKLIEQLTTRASQQLPAGLVGPGDDCAVVPLTLGGEKLWQLITVDTLVEQTHFCLDYCSTADVGWKSLVVSLSDISAMGGVPSYAVIALEAPAEMELEQLEGLYDGLYQAAEHYRVQLVGGDTVSGTKLAVSTTVCGSTQKPPLLRSSAQAGDDLWVSGVIGASGAGLQLLSGALERSQLPEKSVESLEAAHRRPRPPARFGALLLERGLATAMIDLSDGLLQDAQHIAVQSALELTVDWESVPLAEGLPCAGFDALDAMIAGEDFELLFSAPPSARDELLLLSESREQEEQLPRLRRIGEFSVGRAGQRCQVRVRSENGKLVPVDQLLKQQGKRTGGYQHFV